MSIIIFLVLGVIASLFQLVMVREFVFSIAKNEFSLIAAIGVWLLFCSLGSFCGKRKSAATSQYLPLIFTFIFCLCLTFIHSAKHIIGSSYYELTSFVVSACMSIFLIGPVGFLVGYCFAQFARLFLEEKGGSRMKQVGIHAYFFAYEAIGFFIAGIVFSFFLSAYANPFFFAVLPLLLVPLLPLSKKKRFISIVAILLVAAVFSASYFFLLKKEFQNAAILSNRGSPYGPLIETERFGVQSLYVSGNLVATSEDTAWQEAFVHTIIASCEKLDKVLIIGAASFEQIRQIRKYDISVIECVELNPLLVSWCQEKLSRSEKEQIRFIVDDPRSYLRTTSKTYDCILMNATSPASIALNRYFSLDFFALIKKRLTQNGVFAFAIASQRDILSPRFVQFNSCILNTVDRIFSRRFIVPSDLMFILASKGAVFSQEALLGRFEARKPTVEYFTSYHLEDLLDAGHRNYVAGMIDHTVSVNTDDRPLAFFYYALLQEAKFYPKLALTPETLRRCAKIFFLAFLGFWFFLVLRRPFFGIYFQAAALGFASISLTSILIVLVQVFSGALFWKVGIVIGACMLGLAFSVFLVNAIINRIGFKAWLLSILCLIWFFLFATLLLGLRSKSPVFYFVFTLYTYSFLGGLCTGAMYPLLSRLLLVKRAQHQTIAGKLYSADLLGAFFGTFFSCFILLTVFGIEATLNILIAIMFLCGLQALRLSR